MLLFSCRYWHLLVKTLTGKEVRKIDKEIVHDISSDYMLRQLTVQIELEVDSEDTVGIKCLQITWLLIGYLDPASQRESRRTLWRASPTTAIDLWRSTTVRIAWGCASVRMLTWKPDKTIRHWRITRSLLVLCCILFLHFGGGEIIKTNAMEFVNDQSHS